MCTYVDTACGEILQDVVRAHWQAFIRDIKPLRVGSFGTRSLGLNVLDDYCERTLLYAYKHYPHETTCFSQVPLIQADPCVSASFSKLEESELRNLSTRTIRREFDRLCHTVSRTSYDRSNARCILKNTVKHPSAAWIVAVQTLHDTIVPAEMTQLAEKLVPLLALFAAVDMTKEKGRRHPSEPEVRIPSKEFLASIGAWRRAGKDPLQQEVIAAFIDDLWPDNGEYIDNSHGNLGMFAGMRMILLERKEFHPHPQDQSLLAEIESLAASPRVYLDATGRLHESAAPRVVPVIQVTAKLHTRDLRALFRGSYEALLLNLLFRTPVVHSTLSELLCKPSIFVK